MPDFSYLRGNDFRLPQIDVYGPYKQALTLRQLTDEREYRKMQMRALDLKAQQEAREEREREAFKVAVARGEDPEKLISVHPELAYSLITKKAAARTAQRLEEEAQARLDKAAAEKQDKVRQQVANIGMQAAGLPNQPQGEGPNFANLSPGEQFFNTQVASTLIDQGIVPAEQFSGFQMPQDMAAAKRAWGAAYGPDKVQAYEAAEQTRKNTALEILGKQWEDVSRRLEGVTGQPSWTKLLGELPVEISSQFNPVFSPPELARAKRMALSAAQRQQGQPNTLLEMRRAVTDPATPPEVKAQLEATIKAEEGFQLSKQAQANTEALASTVMANPTLWENLNPASQAQIAPRLAEWGFTGFGKAPSADQQKAQLALTNFEKAVKAYRDELNATEPSAVPGKIPRLKALFTDMTLQAKEMAQLGALAGPDMALLQGMFTDPNTIAGAWISGKSGLLAQLDVGESIARRKKESLAEVYGKKAGGNQPAAPAQPQPSAAPAAGAPVRNVPLQEVMPGQVLVKAPNGKTYAFPNAAEADAFKKRAGIK